MTSLQGAARAGAGDGQDGRQKLRVKDFAAFRAATVTKQVFSSQLHCDAKYLHVSFSAKQLLLS